jgi:hypothetical protein
MIFHLSHSEARRRALEAVAQAPAGYRVRVDEPKRTLDQNAKLHAELQEIAETVEWAGKKRDVETWKRLLTAAWLRARGEPIELLPAIDGAGVDVVFRSTSTLTVQEMNELIEFICAWRASR